MPGPPRHPQADLGVPQRHARADLGMAPLSEVAPLSGRAPEDSFHSYSHVKHQRRTATRARRRREKKTCASIYRVVFRPFVKKVRLLNNCFAVSPWLARIGFFADEENSPELFLIGPSDFGKSQIRAVWGIQAVWGQLRSGIGKALVPGVMSKRSEDPPWWASVCGSMCARPSTAKKCFRRRKQTAHRRLVCRGNQIHHPVRAKQQARTSGCPTP